MPTDLKETADDVDDDSRAIRYDYKASLVGSAHQFELTDEGLVWEAAGRSGVWAYRDIAAIRLSFRPSSMQSRRFRADIWNNGGERIRIMSTSWQTVSLMTPQDDGYRTFVKALHARMAAAGSTAILIGGLPSGIYAAGLVVVGLLAIAMIGLFVRAVATSQHVGALFLVGFAMLFYWQIGGFIRRNRPVAYTFDHLPRALLP